MQCNGFVNKCNRTSYQIYTISMCMYRKITINDNAWLVLWYDNWYARMNTYCMYYYMLIDFDSLWFLRSTYNNIEDNT